MWGHMHISPPPSPDHIFGPIPTSRRKRHFLAPTNSQGAPTHSKQVARDRLGLPRAHTHTHSEQPHVHTHVHMHSNARTHTHSETHTLIHTHTPTRACAHLQGYAWVQHLGVVLQPVAAQLPGLLALLVADRAWVGHVGVALGLRGWGGAWGARHGWVGGQACGVGVWGARHGRAEG